MGQYVLNHQNRIADPALLSNSFIRMRKEDFLLKQHSCCQKPDILYMYMDTGLYLIVQYLIWAWDHVSSSQYNNRLDIVGCS